MMLKVFEQCEEDNGKVDDFFQWNKLKIISKITKMIVVMPAIDDNGECCEAWLGNKSLL